MTNPFIKRHLYKSKPLPNPPFQRSAVRGDRGRDILKPGTCGVEHENVVLTLASGLAPGYDLAEFRVNLFSGHCARHNRVMEIADRARLVGQVGYDYPFGHEARFDLLLVLVVRPDSADESAGSDHVTGDKELARCGARYDYVAYRRRCGKIHYRLDSNAQLLAEILREGNCPGFVPIMGVDPVWLSHVEQCPQLRGCLATAAADERGLTVFPS